MLETVLVFPIFAKFGEMSIAYSVRRIFFLHIRLPGWMDGWMDVNGCDKCEWNYTSVFIVKTMFPLIKNDNQL